MYNCSLRWSITMDGKHKIHSGIHTITCLIIVQRFSHPSLRFLFSDLVISFSCPCHHYKFTIVCSGYWTCSIMPSNFSLLFFSTFVVPPNFILTKYNTDLKRVNYLNWIYFHLARDPFLLLLPFLPFTGSSGLQMRKNGRKKNWIDQISMGISVWRPGVIGVNNVQWIYWH